MTFLIINCYATKKLTRKILCSVWIKVGCAECKKVRCALLRQLWILLCALIQLFQAVPYILVQVAAEILLGAKRILYAAECRATKLHIALQFLPVNIISGFRILAINFYKNWILYLTSRSLKKKWASARLKMSSSIAIPTFIDLFTSCKPQTKQIDN